MHSGRIVFVDDDPFIGKVMHAVMEDDGYEVVSVRRGSQAVSAVLGQVTELVILDVKLPDIDGFSLCAELRAQHYAGPVVFVTGCKGLNEKLEAYRLRADDYLVKPYEPLELAARIKTVLR